MVRVIRVFILSRQTQRLQQADTESHSHQFGSALVCQITRVRVNRHVHVVTSGAGPPERNRAHHVHHPSPLGVRGELVNHIGSNRSADDAMLLHVRRHGIDHGIGGAELKLLGAVVPVLSDRAHFGHYRSNGFIHVQVQSSP